MKTPDWKTTAEVVGMSALVLSLVSVALELRQTRLIARVDVYATLLASRIEVNETISRNVDVWTRGAAGQELSAGEQLIFENQVNNVNLEMITEYFAQSTLGNTQEAEVVIHDFALRLHQNPGARRVWQAHEENLNRNRQALDPDADVYSFWQARILEDLATLDEVRE